MERPNSLDYMFIRYDVCSHEVAPVGCARQLQEFIERYGSVIVRDLMTDTPVEVYEGGTGLLGRPLGQVGRAQPRVVHH